MSEAERTILKNLSPGDIVYIRDHFQKNGNVSLQLVYETLAHLMNSLPVTAHHPSVDDMILYLHQTAQIAPHGDDDDDGKFVARAGRDKKDSSPSNRLYTPSPVATRIRNKHLVYIPGIYQSGAERKGEVLLEQFKAHGLSPATQYMPNRNGESDQTLVMAGVCPMGMLYRGTYTGKGNGSNVMTSPALFVLHVKPSDPTARAADDSEYNFMQRLGKFGVSFEVFTRFDLKLPEATCDVWVMDNQFTGTIASGLTRLSGGLRDPSDEELVWCTVESGVALFNMLRRMNTQGGTIHSNPRSSNIIYTTRKDKTVHWKITEFTNAVAVSEIGNPDARRSGQYPRIPRPGTRAAEVFDKVLCLWDSFVFLRRFMYEMTRVVRTPARAAKPYRFMAENMSRFINGFASAMYGEFVKIFPELRQQKLTWQTVDDVVAAHLGRLRLRDRDQWDEGFPINAPEDFDYSTEEDEEAVDKGEEEEEVGAPAALAPPPVVPIEISDDEDEADEDDDILIEEDDDDDLVAPPQEVIVIDD